VGLSEPSSPSPDGLPRKLRNGAFVDLPLVDARGISSLSFGRDDPDRLVCVEPPNRLLSGLEEELPSGLEEELPSGLEEVFLLGGGEGPPPVSMNVLDVEDDDDDVPFGRELEGLLRPPDVEVRGLSFSG
jgi:hypothetical protein